MHQININRILNGTSQKRFDNARKNLMEDFTESTANEFYYEYVDQPISFIIRNSRNIFSEPYYGYKFYIDCIDRGWFNPCEYERELNKVLQYIKKANKGGVSKKQLQMYTELADRLTDKITDNKGLIHALKHSELHGGKEFLTNFFDNCQEAERDQDASHMERALYILCDIADPFTKLPLGYMVAARYPKYSSLIRSIVSEYKIDPDSYASEDRYKNYCMGITCAKDLISDVAMRDHLLDMDIIATDWRDENSSFNNRMLEKEFRDLACSAYTPVQTPKKMFNLYESAFSETPFSVSGVDSILDFLEEDTIFDESVDIINYDYFSKLAWAYEVMQEHAEEKLLIYGDEHNESLIKFVESSDDIISEAHGKMTFMEWEETGKPNKIIQQHIMTTKEKEEFEKSQRDNQATIRKKMEEETHTRDEKDKLEAEILKEISSIMDKIEEWDASGKEDAESMASRISTEEQKLRKKFGDNLTISEKTKKALKELKEYEIICESAGEPDGFSTSFFEDSDEFNRGTKQKEQPITTSKPKRDFVDKIQDKALDKEAKDIEKMAQTDEKIQKLKNSANAVTQKPRRIGDRLNQMIRQLDKWDENKRKEFLLKPGFRHKILKNLKLAIIYGTTAQIKLAYVPIAMLMRHISKSKDKRIRNELSMELDNEIRICEEKINDANSAGDNARKYELMRIKDKLTAEKTRVRLNSKYV